VLTLLDGLPISQIRQMRTTANAIGPIFLAFTEVALEEMGVDLTSFELFLQNDPLKEFTARGTWIFPPRPSLKLAVDAVEYIAKERPHWRPMQYCGYHIRDAGGTAVQELAVAMANGVAYFEEALSRGLSADQLAPTMFFFLAAGLDIFEEAAKFRAARRLWARLLQERYGVAPELCGVKIFSYTLGGALWAQEPANNITRIAYEALAAALGGVQTLATSSWDEAHSLPSADAANLSVRAQQILAYESGVTKVVDPLGGSYYVEALTDRIERAVAQDLAAILDRGGAVRGIEDGYIETLLADSAYREFQAVQSGERVVVGVNFKPKETDSGWRSAFVMPPNVADEAIGDLNATRARRDPARLKLALAGIQTAARAGNNTIPALIEAARARASMGEITDALASVYGRHSVAQAA
jgi:methylmalonyl-CoA mutase N-terminal domain/subunit